MTKLGAKLKVNEEEGSWKRFWCYQKQGNDNEILKIHFLPCRAHLWEKTSTNEQRSILSHITFSIPCSRKTTQFIFCSNENSWFFLEIEIYASIHLEKLNSERAGRIGVIQNMWTCYKTPMSSGKTDFICCTGTPASTNHINFDELIHSNQTWIRRAPSKSLKTRSGEP